MLIQLQDGQPFGHPVTPENFRQLFPTVSFPAYLTPPDLEEYGFGLYEYTQEPETSRYETAVEIQPELGTDGIWHQTWEIQPMSQDEKDAVDEEKAVEMRRMRMMRLMDCDWTQVPDAYNAGIDIAAWAAYRQELRDITEQPGFPWDITWPTEPEPLEQPTILDYRAFYDALLASPAYAVIRSKAIENSAVLAACVEFIAAIGDAKSGRPNPAAIQACVNLLCAAAQFTEEDLQALGAAMTVGGLDQVYSLPNT